MYKIFVTCHRFKLNPFSNMKKIFFILTAVFLLISCSVDQTQNNLIPETSVNKRIDLNLPAYIDLLVPGGWTYTEGGNKGILIYNTGIANAVTEFKAFDRACPANDCAEPMTFNGSTKLTCSCDNSEYSILDGSSQTPGVNLVAREYLVTRISSSILLITNF